MVSPDPWFAAANELSCSGCGEDIKPDDMIRADGRGGYLCEPCGREPVSVEESVEHDLARLPEYARQGGVASVARYCARVLDEGELAPRDAMGFAREVRLALAQLQETATGDLKGDKTDEVRAQREKRLREA